MYVPLERGLSEFDLRDHEADLRLSLFSPRRRVHQTEGAVVRFRVSVHPAGLRLLTQNTRFSRSTEGSQPSRRLDVRWHERH